MPSFRNELSINDQEIAAALVGEERRQQDGVELIPSENYTYPEVLELLGSVFTNKYSEGYPGRRYYGGQQYTDKIENLARQRACSLFRAEHANVQPLSGSPMNQAGPVPWRSSHPRRAGVPHGAFVQLHSLQDGPVKRRRDRFQRIARDCA